MKLIIAEKHKVAEYIADSLPDKAQNKSGYIESGEYCITWAAGHLLTLCEPKDYDEAYGKWDLSALPIFFEDWKHKIADSGGRGDNAGRLNVINSLMDRSDCLIHAGDTDDEGQCLIDEIIDWFDYKKPVYRLDTNDTTVAGLQKAMARIDDNDLHVPDGLSAYARSVADLMVGVNLSRYFSLKNFPAKLIVGRVQTPTLGLVVDRDLQIENHVKQVYYTIFADMKVDEKIIRTKYTPDSKDPNLDNGKFTEKSSAQNKVDMLSDETISGVEIKTVIEDEQPPLPFNLSELQLYCSQKFGYGLNDVMEITQRLRDDHNAISYNRTDCQYLNENQFGEAAETLDYVAKNLKFRPKQLDPTIKSRCFDDKVTKETAHTAIIPLATNRTPSFPQDGMSSESLITRGASRFPMTRSALYSTPLSRSASLALMFPQPLSFALFSVLSTASGSMSRASTSRAPHFEAITESIPVPQPASITSMPGSMYFSRSLAARYVVGLLPVPKASPGSMSITSSPSLAS